MITLKYREIYIIFLTIIFGALILMIPALWNGYPFMFPDSIDYLTGKPQIYRLPFYHLIVAPSQSLNFIWLTIILQNIILSHLLFKIYNINDDRYYIFIMFITFLMLFSSVSYFSGYLIADIFSSIFLLTSYILFLNFSKLNNIERVYFIILLVFSEISNIVNIYLGIGMLFVMGIITIFRKEYFSNLKLLIKSLGFSILIIISTNLFFFKIWSVAPSGSIFMSALLIEDGSAGKYLEQSCKTKNYKICPYINKLPLKVNDFLWDFDKSPLYEIGGFEGFKNEAKEVIFNTYKQYPKLVINNAIKRVVLAYNSHSPAKDLNSQTMIYKNYNAIKYFFGESGVKSYLESKQMRNLIPINLLNLIDNVVFPSSLILSFTFLIIFFKRSEYDFLILIIFTIAYYFGNLLLCSLVSGVFDRYQARLSWLFPMVCALSVLKLFGKEKA